MLKSPASIHWADPHEREEMIGRLKAVGRVKNYECGMLNRHGEVRRCLTSLRLFSDQINETTFKEDGIQGYIAKPVMRRQIAQIIRDVLGNPR